MPVSAVGSELFNEIMAVSNKLVFTVYGGLTDSFSGIAQQLCVLYVVIIGIMYIKGKFAEASHQLLASIIIIPIVFGIVFSTNGQLYKDWVYTPIMETSYDVSMFSLNLIVGSSSTGTDGVFAAFDNAMATIAHSAELRIDKLGIGDIGGYIEVLLEYGILMIVLAILYALFLATLLRSYVSLAILFAVGGIIILFAAFPFSRHIFFSWLRGLLTHAITPIMASLLMGLIYVAAFKFINEIANMSIDQTILTPSYAIALLTCFVGIVAMASVSELAATITGGTSSGTGGLFGAMAAGGALAATVGANSNKKLGGAIDGWKNPNAEVGGITGSRPYSAAIGLFKGKQKE